MKPTKLPAPHSLTVCALYLILKGYRMSHFDFQIHSESYRLSARIHNLRGDNWPVRDYWERKKTSDNGRVAKYKRFYISAEDLQQLRVEQGERLDKFMEAVKKFESRATSSK